MKRAALILMAVLAMGSFAFAQTSPVLSGEAIAHVRVDVVPNIAVGVITSDVDAGQIAFGEFPAEIIFRIDANVESVKLQVIATDLFKGDVPTSEFKIPVKNTTSGDGAVVQPAFGNPMDGHSSTLAWLNSTTLNGMTGWESEMVPFESGQRGHFSQEVAVTVTYDQIDPELPTGEYSGFVKLVAEIEP